MRRDTRPIVQQRRTTLEPNAKYGQPIGGGVSGFATPEVPPATTEPAVSQQQKMVHEEWGLPATQSGPTPLKAPVSYGLHPEENPAKSKEDMSKRELIELANLLEQRLRSTRTQLVHANMEQNQLHTQLDELNSELSEARTQLTDLRNRLLQDNMTQYLEVQASGSPESFSVGRSDHLTTFSSPQTELRVNPPPAQFHSSQTRLDQMKALFKGGDSFGSPTNSAGGSFLSRAKALATKPFGGSRGANGVAANQPSLDSQVTSPPMLRPLSPQSPRAIDYGSVW
uniref:CCDC92 domain-containing protein n=1 Tax=Mesocestoides corti TaxID=53468 RepID=A0A5K3FMM2_MESCO